MPCTEQLPLTFKEASRLPQGARFAGYRGEEVLDFEYRQPLVQRGQRWRVNVLASVLLPSADVIVRSLLDRESTKRSDRSQTCPSPA